MSIRLLNENPSYFRTRVTEFFDTTLQGSIWHSLKDISNVEFFTALVFGTIFMSFVYRLQITVTTLVAFAVAILLCWLWLTKKADHTQEKTNISNDKLKILNKALQKKRTIFDFVFV